MGDVLRNRKLAPHGLILSPVIVVTYKYDLLVVVEVLGVRAGPYYIFRRVIQDRGRVAFISLDAGVDPGCLRDVDAAQEVIDLQRVDRRSVLGQLCLDHKGLVINRFDGINIRTIAGSGVVGDLHADVKGPDDVIRRDVGSVRPFRRVLQFDGHLGQIVIPLEITVRKQRNQGSVEEIVHIQGLKHNRAASKELRSDAHCVVLVRTDGVVAVHRAPLLPAEIQRLFSWQLCNLLRSGRDQSQGS